MTKIIGSKGGKNDRKILLLNTKKEKRKKQLLLEEENIEKEKIKDKKEKETILNSILKMNKEKRIKTPNNNDININETQKKKNTPSDKQKPSIEKKPLQETIEKQKAKEKEVPKTPESNIIPKTDKVPSNKKDNTQTSSRKKNIIPPQDESQEKNSTKDENNVDITEYLKMEITNILENNIKDNIYELKKMDSTFYTIEQKIEYAEDDSDIKEIEYEINELLKQLDYIRKELASLEKIFELNFPVEEPDNYLIYLVDEYKDRIKNKKELSDDLKHNKAYKSIVDRIVELEAKKEELLEKVEAKKEQFELEDGKLEEMNNSIISIEEAAINIKNLVDKQNEMLMEVKRQVDKTVHVTEKVKYVTKSINHTFMELFLLMSLFKRNLSMRNNAVAVVQTTIILDLINKMCTPITEKVTIKESDVADYQGMIKDCLSDTSKLDSYIDNSLDNISSIRYTFLYDYKECSHLPEYQETIKNLDKIEEDMKTKKDEIKRMNKEIELELEKNNAKVKKYGSLI